MFVKIIAQADIYGERTILKNIYQKMFQFALPGYIDRQDIQNVCLTLKVIVGIFGSIEMRNGFHRYIEKQGQQVS